MGVVGTLKIQMRKNLFHGRWVTTKQNVWNPRVYLTKREVRISLRAGFSSRIRVSEVALH
jgi:hypothetical protein